MALTPYKKRTDAEQWNIDRPRIHALKNKVMATQQGYSDDNYRDTVQDVSKGRTDSSKELKPAERQELISRLSRLAGETTHPPLKKGDPLGPKGRGGFVYPGKPANFEVPERNPQYRKIEACLASRKLPWSYAKAMAKNLCDRERLELCDAKDLQKVIQAFGYDAKRKGLRK